MPDCPICDSGPLSLMFWMGRLFFLICDWGDCFLDLDDLGEGGVVWSVNRISGELAPGIVITDGSSRPALVSDIQTAENVLHRRWESLIV